jgi:two-component system, NarL family, response regulator NreC
MPRTTVLLADDHPLVAEGLAALLRDEFTPDVIVTDITMPGVTGLDALRQMRAEGLSAKVIFLTVHEDIRLAAQALRAGATGFVLKEAAGQEVVAAIHAVLRGRTYVTPRLAPEVLALLARRGALGDPLTSRQREVLRLIAAGWTMKEVAATLGLSTRTAEGHKYQMMQALGVETMAELIRYAIEHGLAPAPRRE